MNLRERVITKYQPQTDSERVNKILALRAEALQLQREARDVGDMTTALILGSELALIDFTLDTEYGLCRLTSLLG